MHMTMQAIWYWQIGLFILTMLGCGFLMFRNRVTLSKLVFLAGMTVIIALQLGVWPIEKRIARLERELATLGENDPNRPAREMALGQAREMFEELAVWPVEERVARMEAELAALPPDAADERPAREAALNRTRERLKELRERPRRLGDKLPINLGMDFKGGTDILLSLKNDPARYNRLTREIGELEARLAAAKAAGDETKAIQDDLDRKTRERVAEEASLSADLSNAVDVIRRRLNNSGLSEIPVFRQGADRVLVQLPGMDSGQADAILNTIARQGRLEFRMAVKDTSSLYRQVVAQGWTEDRLNIDPDTLTSLADDMVDDEGRNRETGKILYDWLFTPEEIGKDGRRRAPQPFLVSKSVELRGDAISSARAEPNPEQAGYYRVGITFTNQGAVDFERITGNNIGNNMAIVLDGRLQSAPTIQARIAGGNAVITGSFDQTAARQLDVVLKSGSLSAKIEEEYRSSVGATLGEDSIRSGMIALAVGLGITLLFMLVYYMIAGVVTDIVLVINSIMIVALLSVFDATLTLPGLAGLVLTIGMAIDANVLIFERIREERERGNPLAKALNLGYKRAFVTIMDSNLTSLITALILHSFGTETVRGFAVTLIFGLISGMFCSLVLTRWIFDALIEYRWISDLRMLKLFNRVNFDFIGKRRPAYLVSGIICVLCLILVLVRWDRNLAQDFTGGALMQIRVVEPLTMNDARDIASNQLAVYNVAGSMQSYGDSVVGADGVVRYASFVLRTQKVELDEARKEELAAAGVQRSGADDFRMAVEQAFRLEPAGIEKIEPLAENRAPAGEMPFRVTLSLRSPIAPRTLAGYLVDQPNIMPLWIGDPTDDLSGLAGRRMVLSALVPFRDAAGRDRDEAGLFEIMGERLGVSGEGSLFAGAPHAFSATTAAVRGAPDENSRVPVRALVDLKESTTQAQLDAAMAGMAASVEGDPTGAAGVVDLVATVVPEYARDGLSETPVSRLGLLVSVPLRDSFGRIRTVDQGRDLVREQFQTIQRAKADVDFTDPFPRFAVIGPSVATEMQTNALAALLLSLAAIFAYIWLRFQFRVSFGLAAIIALTHDVILCLGALALADELNIINGQIDLTVVAALLTMVGYSLNDTIVIFDRIREHINETGRPVVELVNRSLNETLSRTVITSASTLLVVLAMLFLGGEVLRGFSFTMAVGVLVGTYSTLFVAAPFLVEYAHWKTVRDHAKLEEAKAKLAARSAPKASAGAK